MVENVKVVIDLELTDDSIKKQAGQQPKEIGEISGKLTPEKSNKILKNATTDVVQEKVGKIQTQMGNMTNFMKNPTGFIMGSMSKAIPVLGSLIALAMALPEIIDAIGNMLFGAGGPFDRRFRRLVQKEYTAFLTREEQKRRALGLDPLIFTFNNGFGNTAGARATYSLEWTKEGQPFANYLDAKEFSVTEPPNMMLTGKGNHSCHGYGC